MNICPHNISQSIAIFGLLLTKHNPVFILCHKDTKKFFSALQKKRFFFDFSCIYQKLAVPLHRIQLREAGAIPAQSRCCDSQSDVQILISHWLTVNCQLSTVN